ncbi:protein ALTERED PHOSPHATE STARVATION RESPONSE 1 [Rutidosis leptorrhynchoides]|uniref:protein ALTERED PHOSPHATE STARVATION RESPONSE 1 n=1 Tax=Rutidosis leptorrhynchoides TaxID=125765 RepID=UPI003A9A23BC
MGCAASSIEKDEKVQACKKRKRLMKQLVGLREEFADAQFGYLKALKNTGVTLRQFTESESLELENTTYGLGLPPSPPAPLPPSPPPPPPFSPDLMKSSDNNKKEESTQESMEIEEVEDGSTPPPSILSSSMDYWDPFRNLSPTHPTTCETVELVEEENWAETRSEFEDEDMEGKDVLNEEDDVVNEEDDVVGNFALQEKHRAAEFVDDNSSMVSWHTKDTGDMTMVAWRRKKTLEGVFKELDDYFLKASACWKDIAVLVDITKGDSSLPQHFNENKRKRNNSTKVFSALSWTWASKSLQLSRDPAELSGSNEPCKPGGHCITIGKLYAAEQRLYKTLREEKGVSIEFEKKSELLVKQEDENYDWTKTDKTRSSVENLDTEIRRLQHSIHMTCSSILQMIDEELYPQLSALTSGLMHLWGTMYECHKMQNHISQHLNHIIEDQSMDFTSENRRQATVQLEAEVTWWYTSFCKLAKSQREYARVLFQWIQLTDCLVNDQQKSDHRSAVYRFCEEWQLVSDRLPDKVASEAIKNFLSTIQSITLQQAEELNLHKRSEKLERRLQKELSSLTEMEKKLATEGSFSPSNLSPRHPLSIKCAKTEALQNRADSEKSTYLNSVHVTKTMTINNLKTSRISSIDGFFRSFCSGF